MTLLFHLLSYNDSYDNSFRDRTRTFGLEFVPTSAYTKTDGMSSTRHSATAAKSVVVDAVEYGRNLPFNLHAKRSIEHIVILIGRVDKPRPGQWLFDYMRVLSQFCERDRGGHERARGARKIYSARLSLVLVASCVAVLLRKVISFLPSPFPSSPPPLYSPCLSRSSFSAFHYSLSSDRYTPDVNASVGDRARVRKCV